MKKGRKCLALLLAALMFLSLLPVSALAETPDPEEEEHEHEYIVTESAEPSCEEQGYKVYTCDCGDTYTEYDDPLGHDWDEGVVTIAPTTQTEGERTYTCARCGETEAESIDKLPEDEYVDGQNEEDGEPEEEPPEEYPAFEDSFTIDGVRITLKAEEGVFPAGARLSVEKVAVETQEKVDRAVEEVRDEKQTVAVSYTYDIKVLDAEGNERQPQEGQKVEVKFALVEAADSNLEANVYHITEEPEAEQELTAEKLDAVTDENEETVTVETDGFSLYTVEFTYAELQYVLPGNSSVPLSEILTTVGLTGQAEAVAVSDEGLFSASEENGEWIVAAHTAFTTEEWMKVTIGGVTYEITVTDDPGVGRYYIRVTPLGQGYADYYDMYVKVEDAGGTKSETYPVAAEGTDKWGMKKITADLSFVPARIEISVMYQASGAAYPEQLEYRAQFPDAYTQETASDKDIDFCRYSVEYVQGEDEDDLPPLYYIDAEGNTHVQNDYKIFKGGFGDEEGEQEQWFALRDSISESDYSIPVFGNIHLVLCDDKVLECAGIDLIPAGASLTIWCQSGKSGTLTAVAKGYDEAGIAVREGRALTINGGNVFADANRSHGAGIGGTDNWDSGTITINGGVVEAEGGFGGAAIGGGESTSNGQITINGGTVKATSCWTGAAIGGGVDAQNGPITINGGKVIANSKSTETGAGGYSAGIGSGSGKAQGSPIIITGGTVEASSRQGAGIGGGSKDQDGYAGGVITISGEDTIVVAASQHGAGIGSGGSGVGTNEGDGAPGGTITINGGYVIGISTASGAGIGGGNQGDGGTITINGGYVIAQGGSSAFDWVKDGKEANIQKCVGRTGGVDNVISKDLANRFNEMISDAILSLLFSDNYSGAGIGGGDSGKGGTVRVNGGIVVAQGGTNACSAVGWGHDTSRTIDLSIYRGAKVTYGKYEGSEIAVKGVTMGTDKVQKARDFSYARIEPGEPTVTFHLGGVVVVEPVPPQTLTAGDTAQQPEDPVAISTWDFMFDAWYKDEAKTELFDFTQEIWEDTTVYAGWIENAYPLTIRKIWPEGATPPASVVINYTNAYAEGKTKQGTLTLTADGGWEAVVRVTVQNVLTLSEEPGEGFAPWAWTLHFGTEDLADKDITNETKGASLHFDDLGGLEKNAIRAGSAYVTLRNATGFQVDKGWLGKVEEKYDLNGTPMSFKWYTVIDHIEVELQHRKNDGTWEKVNSRTLQAQSGIETDWWHEAFELSVSDPENYRIREVISNEGRTGEDRFILPEGVTKQIMYDAADAEANGQTASFQFRHVEHGREFIAMFYVSYRRGEDGGYIVANKRGVLLSAEKNWDESGRTAPKPEAITVVLQYKDNNVWQTVETKTLTEANGWKTVFDRVCAEDDNPTRVYRVRELGGDGETIAYAENDTDKPAGAGNTAVFTMTDTEGKEHEYVYHVTYAADNTGKTVITNHGTVYSVEKTWAEISDSDRPSVKARLERLESGSGSEEVWTQVELVNLTASMHWKYDFPPVWESGQYRVREVNGDSGGSTIHAQTDHDGDGSDPVMMTTKSDWVTKLFFSVAYQENENGKTVITNTQKSPFSVRKEWDVPAGNQKPESIQVVLLEWYAEMPPVGAGWRIKEGPITLNEANGWKADFATIPDVSGSYWDNYAIRELDKDGNIVIDKNRKDDKESETRYHMPDGKERRESAAYTVGTGVSEYEVTYTVDWNGALVITNALKGVELTVKKVWGTLKENEDDEGKTMKAESVKVVLQYKNSSGAWETEGEAVELNEDNSWQHTFTTAHAGVNNYRIRELNDSGKIIYAPDDADRPQDAKSSAVFPVREGEGEKAVDITFKVEYEVDDDGATTVTNTPDVQTVKVEKNWDIDWQKNDKPDSIEAVIQQKKGESSEWETVALVELNKDNSYEATRYLPKTGNGEYRVRELKEKTALQEFIDNLKEQINGATGGGYDGVINYLKQNGGEFYSALPESIRSAADQGMDKLKEELNTTTENLYDKLIEALGIASALNRIVYDKDDADKPGGEGDSKPETNAVTYHVGGQETVPSGNAGDVPSGEEGNALSGSSDDAHVTKYRVSYDKKSDGTYTITNMAILEIDVIKRWLGIGTEDEDMPDSAWVVLMFSVKPDDVTNAKNAGVDTGSLEKLQEYEFPVFTLKPVTDKIPFLLEGGGDPVKILTELVLGVDLDIFGDLLPNIAIRKVTKEDNWTAPFVVSKYAAGISAEFKGAELGSEIIRQIIKYVANVDLKISYNPFENFFSIPTKAIRTLAGIENPSDLLDFSKLSGKFLEKAQSLTMEDIRGFGPSTLLDDWHMMANVINIKIDWEIDPSPDTPVITKTWADDKEADRPEYIKVHVKDGDQELEGSPFTLNKSSFAGSDTWTLSLSEELKGHDLVVTREEYPEGYQYKDNYSCVIDGLSITNTWHDEPQDTVNISGRKIWRDNNDQDGVRPETITIRLLADGESVRDKDGKEICVKASEAGGWKWIFANRPKYREGTQTEIVYTITEDPVEGYESEVDEFNVINTHETEKTEVTVRKVWDDGNNHDGFRPDSVTIKLTADGVDTGKTLKLSKSNNWRGSFSGLDKKKDGKPIVYRVEEVRTDVITGTNGRGTYAVKVTANDVYDFKVTNTHSPQTINIVGRKEWAFDEEVPQVQPASITIRLKADGEEIRHKTVTAADNWQWSFTDLLEYNNGRRVVYTVTEDAIPDYKTAITGTAAEGFLVTNYYLPDTMSISISKVWKDRNDQDGIRPEDVTVRLLANGREVGDCKLYEEINWEDGFDELPVKDLDGNVIEYTVEEDRTDVITGTDGEGTYAVMITGDAKKGFTITNTHTPQTVNVDVIKLWDDEWAVNPPRPPKVTIRLRADGREVASKDVTAEDGWKCSFTKLQKYRTGTKEEIVYTVSEDTVPDYTSKIRGYVITNEYTPEMTQVRVTKVWDDSNDQDGIRPQFVTVNLLADGRKVNDFDLYEAIDWTDSFIELPAEKDGKPIEYSIEEVRTAVISGTDGARSYAISITGDAEKGYTITNKHTPQTMTVSGEKTWNDNENQDGARPASITIRLRANGAELASRVVTADDDGKWTWSFPDLPKYSAGREIVYTVTEDAVTDYTASYSGWNVTNTHTPGKTQVTVSKVWNDGDNKDRIRPTSVTVKLLADNVDTGKTLTLSASNSWTGSFTDLDAKKAGKAIAYTVEEQTTGVITGTDGKGTYAYKITGSAAEGFSVTNTHTPVPEPKTYTITYVLNGGVYAGSRADIRETYPAGTVISIHPAPVRSGYRFLYWQGSAHYPGESYTVTGNHTFTAQWERTNEPPDSARTGDNSRLGLWTLLMLLSLSCLAFIPGVVRKKGSQ